MRAPLPASAARIVTNTLNRISRREMRTSESMARGSGTDVTSIATN
jgi:hypothetical protein